ncbi:MAG: molybdopterin-dependent oxidoreductase [Candidatus Nanopelagicales bacterium]|nr:molybdopterin-dependent oxidoreductase [Candidatus Nanopelagicales bacterium]
MAYEFVGKIGRRRFIKGAGVTAAAVAGTAVVGGCASTSSRPHEIAPNPEGEAEWGREAGEWIPSACNMCGGQSGIFAHVVNGKVIKIEPNPWNPVNYSNISTDFFDGYTEEFGCKDGGVICPKGNAGLFSLYDPDRVKTPLKRTNPDKSVGADPQWQEISWDAAITEIAEKMGALRSSGNAHKLLWMSEDHSFTHPQVDFCALFGTPNYVNHSNLCDVERKASYKTVMGDERPLADFLQSKFIMLFGWNPTSAIKWVYLPRILTQGIQNGARLVVVDPYLSDTAAHADEWVPIRPGTDGALALAMANVIISEKLYDAAFVKDWTVGFKEYAAYVATTTPQWAEEITSVPAATIQRLARELAKTKPALVDTWSGPGQQSNGVQGGRAIALLNALLGTYDAPGGMVMPSQKGPKHVSTEPDAVAEKGLEEPRFDEMEKYPLAHKSGVYTQMFSNLLEGKGPYTPEMMMCVFQNPVMSVPGANRVAEALAKLKTLVVIDTMMSETAKMADYVLPGTTYLERYDLNSSWITWASVSLRQPVVAPIFGQPAEYETVALLGRKLGLKSGGKNFFLVGAISGKPVEDTKAWYEEQLSSELLGGGPAMTLDEMKQLPGAVWVSDSPTAYKKYATEVPADKLATAVYLGPKKKDGTYTYDPKLKKTNGTLIYDKPKEEGGKQIGIVRGGKPIRGFFTNTGRVDFVNDSLEGKVGANGKPVDTLPRFTPREWLPSEEYPLYMVNWKEASHTHSRTQNNSYLLELKPSNPIAINPATADRLGVKDGQEITITSPYGEVSGVARVTPRIHPDVVGGQWGFGHTALGQLAAGRGTHDGYLKLIKGDPFAGQALHKEICVRVAPQ